MHHFKFFFITLFLGAIFLVLPVYAAGPEVKIRDADGFSAKFVSQSAIDPIVMEAGSVKTVVIKFKNTGTATWNGGSAKYISAYTMEPRERASVFRGDDWVSSKQTDKINGVVKPGSTGELIINLQAPAKAGEYTEKFYLAAENYSWVNGGYFFLKIKVTPAKVVVSEKKPETVEVVGKERGVNLTGLNAKKFTVEGGADISLITIWRNAGKDAWNDVKLVNASSGDIISQNNNKIAVGDGVRFDSVIKAPAKKGQYQMQYRLKVDGEDTGDKQSVLVVDIEVISDALATNNQVATPIPMLAEEPKIRVGIWKPTDSVQLSSADDCNVFDGATLMGVMPKGTTGVLSYADGKYRFWQGSLNFETTNYIRIEPINDWRAVFTLYNYDHKVSWKGPMNFNKYRGAIEYRMSEKGTMYVINEVLFEDYIAGISETSSGAPLEFIKANLVAARSYAYYIKENTDKHDSRYFDVVGTTGDQLYLGYQSEVLMPRVVQAQQETRGMMVIYDGKIVITPYFGNSNGWTRSYVSAWGGSPRSWLVPVLASYDKGRARLGHGVGMSQRDCALRAEKEGLDYISLVKYYYTGVEVEKIYN